jgi:hypothetical protein
MVVDLNVSLELGSDRQSGEMRGRTRDTLMSPDALGLSLGLQKASIAFGNGSFGFSQCCTPVKKIQGWGAGEVM